MDQNNIIEKIIIIDFGSQFTQLIARKIRELGAYSEIINFKQIKGLTNNKSLKGIVLSGGPLTVTNKNAATLNTSILSLKVPILGICYGHQILAKKLGGRVKISKMCIFGWIVSAWAAWAAFEELKIVNCVFFPLKCNKSFCFQC